MNKHRSLHTVRTLHTLIVVVSTLASIALVCASLSTFNFDSFSSLFSSQTAYAATDNSTGSSSENQTANQAIEAASAQGSQKKVTISFNSQTSILSSTSGYKAKLTVTNNTDNTISQGIVGIYTNTRYSFSTSSDIQSWAEGNRRIPTNQRIGTAEVNTLAPGDSQTITISASADDSTLSAMTTWGARPILVTYSEGSVSRSTAQFSSVIASIHTFVTRTNADVNTAQTPALNMVLVLPVSASTYSHAKSSTRASIINGRSTLSRSSITQASSSRIFTSLSSNVTAQANVIARLVAAHSSIQTIEDPSSAQIYGEATAIMQPYTIDLAAIGQTTSSLNWSSTGISAEQYNEGQAQKIYQDRRNTSSTQAAAQSESQSATTSIAMQTQAAWTASALDYARELGYTTVIATTGYSNSPSVLSTEKITASTNHGDITILPVQKVLTKLALNKATSKASDGETTESGRIARFIAQSAFYQSQAPYTQRTVLVALQNLQKSSQSQKSSSNYTYLQQLLAQLDSATWINQSDLSSLISQASTVTGQDATDLVNAVSGINSEYRESLAGLITVLSKSKSQLNNFESNILLPDSEQNSDTGNKAGTLQDDAPEASEQTAPLREGKASDWMYVLHLMHNTYAIQSVSSVAQVRKSMSVAATAEITALYKSITLSVPNSITIVSNSASIPVTITSTLPFDIKVGVSVKDGNSTTADGINVQSADPITVRAYSQQQVTLAAQTTNGWKSSVKTQLMDSHKAVFGSVCTMNINSQFHINDKIGYVIFAVAIVLGVLGARKQIQREEKDSDS